MKKGRRVLFYAVTVLVLLGTLAANVLFAYAADAFHWHIDLTDESLYTMSDEFVRELDATEGEVTITFCADPDVLMADEMSRIVYYMAIEMALRFDNIHVKTVNIERDPGAVQQYKDTSASEILWNYVIISSDAGYQIRDTDSFWLLGSDDEVWSFKGEFEMASIILSLLSVEKPKICVTYGHGEDDPAVARERAFYRMIPSKLNAEVVFINLDTEDIPQDCVLLLIDGATRDYAADITQYEEYEGGQIGDYLGYVSPTEKIERYLDNFGSVMVLKDPFVELPVLQDLLEGWGIAFTDTIVKDKAIAANADARTRLVAEYADAEEHALGNSFYSDIAALETAPDAILDKSGAIYTVWEDGKRMFSSAYSALYSPVLLSSPDAQTYNEKNELVNRDGDYHLVSVVNRCYTDPATGNLRYAYVMASATTALIDDKYIEDNAYSNADIVYSSMRHLMNQMIYSSMDISGNGSNGGKILWDRDIHTTQTTVYLEGREDASGNTKYEVVAGLTDTAKTVYTVILLALPVLVIVIVGFRCYWRRRLL